VGRRPRIVGVAPGDPFDRLTWSGISHHLFTALQRKGVLDGAVDATPPRYMDVLAKVLAFHPRRRTWVERYELGPIKRIAMSRSGAARVGGIDERPEALLQIGAWYDFAESHGPTPRLRCSYHDSNLALFTRHSGLIPNPEAAHVRRTFQAERRVFDRLDVIFTMSDWLRQSFIEDFDQPESKVMTIGAGANLEQIPGRPPERDFGRPRFLFVGIEFERKGGEVLLAAFERVRASDPRAELWLVGPEPRPTPAPGVRWCGRIKRDTPEGDRAISRLYAEATAYVMPSRYEPFGIAFLEAMAHGLPCVGTSACAMPEIIEAGVTGQLVPPDDVDALADALAELTENPDLARRMGEAGRKRVGERFTWDQVTTRMVGRIEAELRSSE
jgi:glycosyltransferase involved in cell wall biosynthesis